METIVFKRVDGCDIALDLYLPESAAAPPADRVPLIVWIHGGALIMGSRRGIRPPLRDLLVESGFAVAAIDYRLAPETKLPAILEDVLDAFSWLRSSGAQRFHLDPARLGVVGNSAGGYLTLMAGVHVEPKPRVLVSFYGYGDITAPWYSRPDPFYCSLPAIDETEARSLVGTTPLTDGAGSRGIFYRYTRQHGLWPREVAGFDPERDDRAFDPYCPIRNVSSAFPPTLLLHGTADTDVPYQQSADMAAALKEAGVTHELITIPDGPHGFDNAATPEDGTPAGQALQKARDFLRTHV